MRTNLKDLNAYKLNRDGQICSIGPNERSNI